MGVGVRLPSAPAASGEGGRLSDAEIVPVRQGGKLVKVSQHEAIRRAELYVTQKLPKYLKKLEELANGIVVMKPNKRGVPVVYSVPPDRQALEYLVDRGMGKPPQRFEFTGEGGPKEPIPWAPAPDVIEAEVRDVTDAETTEG